MTDTTIAFIITYLRLILKVLIGKAEEDACFEAAKKELTDAKKELETNETTVR